MENRVADYGRKFVKAGKENFHAEKFVKPLREEAKIAIIEVAEEPVKKGFFQKAGELLAKNKTTAIVTTASLAVVAAVSTVAYRRYKNSNKSDEETTTEEKKVEVKKTEDKE